MRGSPRASAAKPNRVRWIQNDRTLVETRCRPFVDAVEYRRRENLSAYERRRHTGSRISDAIEDVRVAAEASEYERAGSAAINRTAPGVSYRDVEKGRVEPPKSLFDDVRLGWSPVERIGNSSEIRQCTAATANRNSAVVRHMVVMDHHA